MMSEGELRRGMERRRRWKMTDETYRVLVIMVGGGGGGVRGRDRTNTPTH